MGKMNHQKAVKERHKAAAALKEMETKLAVFEHEKAHAVKAAVDAVTELHKNAVERLELAHARQLDQLYDSSRELRATIDATSTQVVDLASEASARHFERDGLAAAIKEIADERDRLRAAVAGFEPTVTELTGIVDELRELLGRVEGRMKKREIERREQLLNRAALCKALLVPEPEPAA